MECLDLIIEILSPHTTKKDVQDKFDLYEESGAKEYWIVEPKNQTVEVFVLENEKYRRIQTYVSDDVIPLYNFDRIRAGFKRSF
ncbi:MAG: Uma2 family endonuclease [Saprospiraceae bacterium]